MSQDSHATAIQEVIDAEKNLLEIEDEMEETRAFFAAQENDEDAAAAEETNDGEAKDNGDNNGE